MRRFEAAAVGGTFDLIHRGHDALLDAAFGAAETVIIGLSGDGFAAGRGKRVGGYGARRGALEGHIRGRYPGRAYEIRRLDDRFGPAATEARVGALIVSAETRPGAEELNAMRAERGAPPAEIITVPMALAEDGGRISSTRVRRGEIHPDGRLA